MSTAYSALKAAWHRRSLEDIQLGRMVVPRQVQLILSDLCNHDCSFCAYRISEGFSSEEFGEDTGKGFTMNPNRQIPTEKAREIIQDLAHVGVPAIQFTGGGEPTVHPDHLTLFREAMDLGLEAALVSNGSKLVTGWEEVLPRMAWIRISLDAGTEGTYAKVRRVSARAFSKTLGHLEALASEIYLRRAPTVLGTSFIVTNENWREVGEAARVVKEAGARHLRVAACFTTKGVAYYARPLERYQQEIQEAQERYADQNFQVVNMFASRAEDLLAQAPTHPRCGYQRFNVYVAGNLRVYRCCTTSYTPHGEVGDLRQQRFRDWLHSAEALKAYQDFDARTCRSCPFQDKNQVINYLLDEEPLHVNFV